MLSEHCEQMCALLCRKGVHDEANAYRDEMDRINDDRAAHDAAAAPQSPTPPPGHKLDGERLPKAGEWFYASWGAWERATYDWEDCSPVRCIAIPIPQFGQWWMMQDGQLICVHGARIPHESYDTYDVNNHYRKYAVGDFAHPATREEWAAAFPGLPGEKT